MIAGVAAIVLAQRNAIEALHGRSSSCANHSGQWRFPLGDYIDKAIKRNSETAFPITSEFDNILTLLGQNGHSYLATDAEGQRDNLYCPGRQDSRQITGYVFIGSGLPVKTVYGKDALIVFCAAGCHPLPYDHAHAFTGMRERDCVNHAKMLDLLARALQQAETGDVPYAHEAVAVLKNEIIIRTVSTP